MRRAVVAFALIAALVAGVLPAGAHPGSHPVEDRGFVHHGAGHWGTDDGGGDSHELHGGPRGHMPAVEQNVKRVGSLKLAGAPSDISDVSALMDNSGFPLRSKDGRMYAYVGDWLADCTDGGIHIADVTDPARPVKVGFLDGPGKTYATEGIQALRVSSPSFTGDLLLWSHEWCASFAQSEGGFSLWDVTNPRRPRRLSIFGDDDVFGTEFNESHSIIGWDAGDKLYAAAIDNVELEDVDIFDITNPSAPRQIADFGFLDIPGLSVEGYGEEATSHDFDVVQLPGGRWILTISYWDVGWVSMDLTNPSRPRVYDESDYSECDPVYGPPACPPEGNGHQSEWNDTRTLFFGTDEDQVGSRTPITIVSGPGAGESIDAGQFAWTVPVSTLPDGTLNGPIVYGGYGCPDDRGSIPPASVVGPLGPGEEAIIVFQRGPVSDPNNPGAACLFSEKVESAQLAGYDGVIVANHHAGAQGGATPDSFLCGSMGHDFDVQIPGLCVGHRFLHVAFGYPPDYTLPYPSGDPGDVEPDVGDLGGEISATSVFDGWGYARVLNRDHEEIGQWSLPEQADPQFETGFGDLSIHEVEVDPDPRYDGLVYAAWYSLGFRVGRYEDTGGDTQTVGSHISQGGNELWGVALGLDQNDERVVYTSDRHFGLVIYRYTGPLP
ncbi:MAG: PA domain-containing protein [Actinomycetota bacterium]